MTIADALAAYRSGGAAALIAVLRDADFGSPAAPPRNDAGQYEMAVDEGVLPPFDAIVAANDDGVISDEDMGRIMAALWEPERGTKAQHPFLVKYNPNVGDEPRDDHGRWTTGGGTAAASEFGTVSDHKLIKADVGSPERAAQIKARAAERFDTLQQSINTLVADHQETGAVIRPTLLSGTSDAGTRLRETVVDALESHHYKIVESPPGTQAAALKYLNYWKNNPDSLGGHVGKTIYVNGKLSPDMKAVVLTNELARISTPKDWTVTEHSLDARAYQEARVEAVTTLVAAHFGLDTSKFSDPYIAGWLANAPHKYGLEEGEGNVYFTKKEQNTITDAAIGMIGKYEIDPGAQLSFGAHIAGLPDTKPSDLIGLDAGIANHQLFSSVKIPNWASKVANASGGRCDAYFAKQVAGNWDGSSHGYSDVLAVHAAIAEKFGIPLTPFVEKKIGSHSGYGWNTTMEKARGMADGMYAVTQDALTKAGIDGIYAFRGMHAYVGGDPPQLKNNVSYHPFNSTWDTVSGLNMSPVSSWSVAQGVAGTFAGKYQFYGYIPKERIFSINGNGPGGLGGEAELTVIDGGMDLSVRKVNQYD